MTPQPIQVTAERSPQSFTLCSVFHISGATIAVPVERDSLCLKSKRTSECTDGQTDGRMKASVDLPASLPSMPAHMAGTGASVCVPVCVDII